MSRRSWASPSGLIPSLFALSGLAAAFVLSGDPQPLSLPEACLSSAASVPQIMWPHANGWMSVSSHVYRSPGAGYARIEDLRCPWLKSHRLVSWSFWKQCYLLGHWLADRRDLRRCRLLGDHFALRRRLIFIWKRVMPTGADLPLGASSRNLNNPCLKRFDGRHNPSHAGTLPKSLHVPWAWKILLCISYIFLY